MDDSLITPRHAAVLSTAASLGSGVPQLVFEFLVSDANDAGHNLHLPHARSLERVIRGMEGAPPAEYAAERLYAARTLLSFGLVSRDWSRIMRQHLLWREVSIGSPIHANGRVAFVRQEGRETEEAGWVKRVVLRRWIEWYDNPALIGWEDAYGYAEDIGAVVGPERTVANAIELFPNLESISLILHKHLLGQLGRIAKLLVGTAANLRELTIEFDDLDISRLIIGEVVPHLPNLRLLALEASFLEEPDNAPENVLPPFSFAPLPAQLETLYVSGWSNLAHHLLSPGIVQTRSLKKLTLRNIYDLPYSLLGTFLAASPSLVDLSLVSVRALFEGTPHYGIFDDLLNLTPHLLRFQCQGNAISPVSFAYLPSTLQSLDFFEHFDIALLPPLLLRLSSLQYLRINDAIGVKALKGMVGPYAPRIKVWGRTEQIKIKGVPMEKKPAWPKMEAIP
jgi:hypothetical protein